MPTATKIITSNNLVTDLIRETPSTRIGVDWSIAAPLVLAHAVAIAAPFTFTWLGLYLFVGLYMISGIGVTAGAHRLFTHASFQASPFFRKTLALMFLLSAQGSLLRWVRDHHIHHSHSDKQGDPHTPHMSHGFWHAQLTWLWKSPPTKDENKILYQRFGGRLRQDNFLRITSNASVLLGIHLGLLLLVYFIGAISEGGFSFSGLIHGWYSGLSCVVWGVFLRIIAVLNATSLVNSATHLWGYRNYATPENSRNNWWVALVSLGEGWHNNHHSKPATANQGFHRWWEFDITFCILVIAATLGLAYNLRVYRAKTDKTEIWFPKLKKRDTH